MLSLLPLRRAGMVAASVFTCVVASSHALAQWTIVDRAPAEIEALPVFVRPQAGTLARIDWPLLDAALAQAPKEAPGVQGSLITLPMPGGVQQFTIVDSPIMEPGLAAKFPQFKTYRVIGITDPGAVGRIDITSHGFRGMIRTPAGAVFIDPYSAQQREYVSAYYLHDQTDMPWDWSCATDQRHGAGMPLDEDAPTNLGPGPVNLKTYRLAMCCTGEYGAFQSSLQGHAPNVADALSAIVTVTNRVNVVYEVELAVRLLLVSNNDLLAFYDPATDPYPNADPTCTSDPSADCSSPYLNVNTGAINTRIGNTNFDIGHVLTRVRGGVAYLSAVCGNNKGGGVSGIPRGGDVDPISALVPMHEMGHQFGANHTFAGDRGRCHNNLNGPTAWEPGSGSTIMAYPGGCPVGGPLAPEPDTDNIAIFASTYFNTGSLTEMRNFLNATASNCFQTLTRTNTAPVITTPPVTGLPIPPNTPFALTLDAADDDGPALLANWDALDHGPGITINTPDNGTSALFRSVDPGLSFTRVFPRWSDVLGQTSTPGERLPTFTPATRRFRCTLRDNAGGVTQSSIITVSVVATTPFRVTAPTAAQRNNPGSAINVAWDVSGTNALPFNSTDVLVYLSPTGDQNFTVLLGQTPNDGAATFTLPANVQTDAARILVAPTSPNIFFAVSPSFMIQPPCDSIDFNRDGLFPDTADIDDFLSVFSGGACSNDPHCGDIDFNNDSIFPDTADIDQFLLVFSGGACA